MVRLVAALLVFGGLLATSTMSIAQVEDGRVKILLERITGDGPFTERRRAERELERLGEDAVFGLMLIATENPDNDVRSQAMEALERIVSDHSEWRLPRLVVARIDYFTNREYLTEEFGEDAEEFLIQNAGHPLAKIRRNALYLLSFLDLPSYKVLPIYRKAFEDAEPTVRAAAAVGMFRSGERIPKAIETLVGTVATEQFNDVIKETIRENEHYFNEPLARRIIDPESSDEVVVESSDLLSDACLSAAFNPLREALHSENQTVQVRAAIALAQLGYDTPSVADILAKEIEDAGPMRDAVLDAVETPHLNSKRIHKVILDLTRSENPSLFRRGIRLAASKGLVEQHAGELAKHLLEPTRLRTTVNVLSRRNHSIPYKPEYLVPLESLVLNDSVDSRAAIHVLLCMGKPGIEAVMGRLNDPERDDRLRVILLQELEDRMGYLNKEDPLNAFLDQIADLLDDENLEVACHAAMALLRSGYSTKAFTPILLKGYASDNDPLSDRCYFALRFRGQDVEIAVPFLLRMLEDADAAQHKKILSLLNDLGGDLPQVVDLLVEYLLSDIEDYTRSQFALNIKQPVVERLESQVDQGTTENQRRAMVALCAALERSKGFIGPSWKEVEETAAPPGVIAALSAVDKGLRYAAVRLLLSYQPQAEEALPVLREIISSESRPWQTLTALQQFKPAIAPLLPELVAVIKNDEFSPDDPVRKLVLSLLSKIGPEAAPALPDLIELLDDPEIGGRQIDWRGHSGVPEVLASIGEAAKPAEPFLIEILPEAESLTAIGKALKSMSGSTDELVAEMDRRLDDPILCYQAVKDLPVIGDLEPITSRLIKILKGDDLQLKRDVADMLASRSLVRDPVLVPLLMELLQEESARVREKAIGALAEHDVPVQVLIERLQNDESIDVLQAVLDSLEVYAGRLLKDYRQYASISMMSQAQIERSVQQGELPELSAMAAIPALEELLRLPDEQCTYAAHLRLEAAYALAKFRETAKRSLPLLLELHGRSRGMGEGERLKLNSRGLEMWENALLTAIWSIDLETALENELPPPRPRRAW